MLTHCNAGWLATVDWGTATSPIYQAHEAGLPVHVWVDETRPRNQGASLTAWELGQAGVPHTLVIADNAGGHLMQHGLVDIVIVGCDRVTARGDVCNKIGTYLKALAAQGQRRAVLRRDADSSTLDLSLGDGLAEIPIEERSGRREVTHIAGPCRRWRDVVDGAARRPTARRRSANPAFDVTPARLVTGLITERGIAGRRDAAAIAASMMRLRTWTASRRPCVKLAVAAMPQARRRWGMNRGSTGNLSLRACVATAVLDHTHRHGRPTSIARDRTWCWLGHDDTLHQVAWKPSSEWHFHRAIYLTRPDLQAIVHTHSVHATALACLRRRVARPFTTWWRWPAAIQRALRRRTTCSAPRPCRRRSAPPSSTAMPA